ncbi:hypothetical protein GSI_13815 [Ganoderma sinense ZZ0214-1]|uniref:MYND-type domain-containing protein n=1 Tax=Ganoderma sinense ZZ0214-1 TaxID=1077348 RepID=A0A2G8RRC8_9APHY|nr:hypothetical protein GSI_13815 [Ganoderma sinense ZZ0214-1]
MAGRPNPPLKDWERTDKLNVELIGYGWDERRVMVRFHLPKDRDPERIQTALRYVGRDVKHSKNWTCEFCGKPSRETHVQTMFWHHLDPPRVIVYIHYVCDMDKPHVQAGLTEYHNMMDSVNQGHLGPMPDFPPPKPSGLVYPLAGSCACCERDATAADTADMKKCSKCKLTRYCGAECQKKDWPRHKVACGQIYSVNFENWV